MTSAPLKTPLEMFYHWEASNPDQVFLRQAENLQWRETTWAEFGQQVRSVAAFIHSRDYEPGSRIAILSANSADWFVADLAIMLSGHISVPLYPGQDIDSGRYILEHSECRLIFLGSFNNAAQVDEMVPKDICRIGMLGCQVETDYLLGDVIGGYSPYLDSPLPHKDDIFTILYTSGTTGRPKGVMHAHGTPANVAPRLVELLKQDQLEDRGRFFSYLPLSHAGERILVEMLSLYTNPTVSFSAGLETFAEELRSVNPTMFFSVPRLWMRFKEGIDAKFPAEVQEGFGADEKSFVRQVLGLDQAKVIITGSAPLPSDVQQWFIDMGILLQEGYGMTENFIDGTTFRDGTPIPGCVGKPGQGVEVRINDDGEICFRSNGLMKGYYLDPDKTAEVLIDGWYHTGDSGRIDEDGNLWVTGRISEVFKTSKGKFVVPTAIEDKLTAIPELGQFMIFGHGLDQPLLLANLTESARASDADQIDAQLIDELAQLNQQLPRHEQIAKLLLCREDWSIENALLTPTMKLKRRAIEEHYAPLVERAVKSKTVLIRE